MQPGTLEYFTALLQLPFACLDVPWFVSLDLVLSTHSRSYLPSSEILACIPNKNRKMVYANYVPAKLPTIASDLDKAIMAVQSMESLEVVGKLLYNAAVAPKDEKYRKIRLTNEKINKLIVETPNVMEALLQLGWAKDEADPEFLTIPQGKYMSMKEVRMIEEQKDRVRKEVRIATTEAIRNANKPPAAVSTAGPSTAVDASS